MVGKVKAALPRMRWKRPSQEVYELFVGDEKRASVYSCLLLRNGNRVYVYWAEVAPDEVPAEGWSTTLSYAKAKCEEIAGQRDDDTPY